jgi:U3 small nucleolar RNA-associated protein 14
MQVSQKTLNKRDRLITKVQNEHALKVVNRSDSKMMNVMVSERRIKTAAKYKLTEVPHPFTTMEEYHRSLQMPLGDEWNSSDVVKSNCMPEIKLRAGRVIEPIKLSKKRVSEAAEQSNRLNKPASVKKAKK